MISTPTSLTLGSFGARGKSFGRNIDSCKTWICIGAIVFAAGCAKIDRATGEDLGRGGRNVAAARELNAKGLAKGAEGRDAADFFRRAVRADPYNGAARNNLGVVLMAEGNYYGAANEFEQSILLLPANPQPRLNLGLVYEGVGQLERAQEQYEAALVVNPGYIPVVQALARARIRAGLLDNRTTDLLRLVVLRTTEQPWRQWAQKQLASAGLLPAVTATQPAEMNGVGVDRSNGGS